jgi:biotin operon repressor
MRWERLNEIQYAFVDEYGDYGFDFEKKDGSTHLIMVSILVKESQMKRLEEHIDRIRVKYFQTERIDSNRLKHHPKRKLQLLNDLQDSPFHVYANVIDKRKIREDSGITFKKTFFNYANRLIYDDLYRTFEQLDFVADERGHKEFIQEFKKYVDTTSIPNLFQYSSFGFNSGRSDLILQLAELIAGTIAQGYDNAHYSVYYPSFYQAIKHKIITINLLPYDYKHFLYNYHSEHHDSDSDKNIIKQTVNLSYEYIEKNRKNEEADEKIRIDFLKFLLFNLKENPNEYVYTQEILDNLNAIRENKINHHYFRSTIVSKLRDHGLLIASSHKGYKLPVCLNDLYDFVNLSSLTIYPMIQRISKCRDQITLATNGDIDILDQKEYGYLKKIIEMESISINQ